MIALYILLTVILIPLILALFDSKDMNYESSNFTIFTRIADGVETICANMISGQSCL